MIADTDAQCVCDRGRYAISSTYRGKPNERDVTRRGAGQLVGDGEREAGLADAARTRQSHQANIGLTKQGTDGGEFARSAQQRGEGRWKTCHG